MMQGSTIHDDYLRRSTVDIKQQEHSIVHIRRHLPVPFDRKQRLSFTLVGSLGSKYKWSVNRVNESLCCCANGPARALLI